MKRALARAGTIFALASACALGAQFGLARGLSESEFAEFALLFSFFSFAGLLGDAGVTQKYLRHFLTAGAEPLNWPRVFLADLPFACALIAAAGLGFMLLYPTAPLAVGLIMAAALGFVLTQRLTAMLRSVTQAGWVIGLQRAHAFGLLAAMPVIVAMPGAIALKAGLALAAIAGSACSGALIASRRLLARGKRTELPSGRADGLSFGLLLIAGAAFFYADRFVVARFCSTEDFAAYSLAAIFFQVFDLFNSATGFVLAPFFARSRAALSLDLLGRALAFLLPVAVAGIWLVPLAARWGFPHIGPVDPRVALGLAAAGVAKVMYSVLMSHFNLHASTEALRRFAWLSTGLILAGVGLVVSAAIQFGAAGASLAFGTVWATRVLLAIAASQEGSRREEVAS